MGSGCMMLLEPAAKGRRLMAVRRYWTAAALVLVAGCNAGSTGSGAGACEATIEYAGRTYLGHAAEVPPKALGEQLGPGVIPACNDTNASGERDEAVVVVELIGVPPEVAIAATYSDSTVFIRQGSDFESLPPTVRDLIGAP
jgi:hypothetical protein